MVQQFKRHKKLFKFYYLFIIPVIAGIWFFYIHHAFKVDLAFLNIFTAYLLLFSLAFLIINRYHIQIFLFLLTIISGVYGFHHHAFQDYSIANSLYSTLRLFVIDIDNVFTKEGNNFVFYPLEVEIARWSASLYLISTVFQIAYLFFYRSIKLFFFKLFGNHYVISGYQEQSKILIEDLCEKGEHVVLLTEGEGLSSTEKEFLDEMGVIVLVGTKTEHDLYDKAGLHRAGCCILFDEDDSSNLDELISIKEYFLHRSRFGKPLNILLHLSGYQSMILYEEIEKEVSELEEILVRIMNTNRLIADQLLNENPLYLHYEDRVKDPAGEPLHLLFVGFDETNQQITLKAMERAHFCTMYPLNITVLDKEIDKAEKSWFRSYPKSQYVAKFEFIAFDIDTQTLESFIEETETSFTHVFISTGDDYLNIMEGIRFSKWLKSFPVFISVMDEGLLSYQVYQKNQELANLYCFGNYHKVLTKEYFVNEKEDMLAKLIHERYRKQKRKESPMDILPPSWEQLTDFMRESNRSQFNHARTKLMLIGLDVVSNSAVDTKRARILTREEYLLKIQDHLEQLAEIEHRRWCAFHYLRGWDVYPNPTSEKTRDIEMKLHGCLVSWQELDRVMEQVGENYKKYDRNSVIGLYDMWKELDYEIVIREDLNGSQ